MQLMQLLTDWIRSISSNGADSTAVMDMVADSTFEMCKLSKIASLLMNCENANSLEFKWSGEVNANAKKSAVCHKFLFDPLSLDTVLQEATRSARSAHRVLTAVEGDWRQVSAGWRTVFCTACILQATAASLPLILATCGPGTLPSERPGNELSASPTNDVVEHDEDSTDSHDDSDQDGEGSEGREGEGDEDEDEEEERLVGALRLVDLSIIAFLRRASFRFVLARENHPHTLKYNLPGSY